MSDDFFDEPLPVPPRTARERFGPIFSATYASDCPSCFELIQPGEDIRADGAGSFIHADDTCEAVAIREMS